MSLHRLCEKEGVTLIDHPALQDMSNGGPVSGEAATLARAILGGELSLADGIDRMADHLLSDPKVDVMVCALTSFTPEDDTGWLKLGQRAHVREWKRPGDPTSILAPLGGGPEAALTMPWMSQHARADIAVLPDSELLPSEAQQDRFELEAMGVRSLIGTTFLARGEMFGSLSATSRTAGRWDAILVEDIRLLTSAITSRIMLEHSRRALAEAIDAGAEAQSAFQHFFGAVGHEVRTPLATVLGYTEAMVDDAQHGAVDAVTAAMLRDGPVIVRACENLLTILDSLLGAGRTLSGDDYRQGVVIADALADVVHWHRTPARTAGVEICVDVDPTATAWAHASGVRQVLTNLLGNAIVHHHPAGGTVHLSTQRLLGESGKPMVRIIVRDDGPGLTAEQLEHVFEPFVRYADAGTKGSGLGLPISRTIAERDGGAVRGESTPGVGSSFWVELPTFLPPDDATEPS